MHRHDSWLADNAVGYKLVRLTELMAYEFGQVEGDIEALNERDLGNVMPDGVSVSQFKETLSSGEVALLTDTPARPAMVHDSVNRIWSLSPDTETTLSPQTRSALAARANQSGSVAGGASGSGGASHSAHAATNIEDTYVPEPVKPDRSNEPPPLKYEYCFEIASSDKVFSKTVGCKFQLATTQQEGVKDDWQTIPTEHGTKYTTYTAFNEPKKTRRESGLSLNGHQRTRACAGKVDWLRYHPRSVYSCDTLCSTR